MVRPIGAPKIKVLPPRKVKSTRTASPALTGTAQGIFQPLLAGRWYPAHPGKLKTMLSGFLSRARQVDAGADLLGLISPHAGYRYSGPVAAWAYKQLRGRNYRRVVVIAPSHRVFSPYVGTLDMKAYRTPLGDLEIDREAVKKLLQTRPRLIVHERQLFKQEHSLEIQLPFLKQVLPKIKLVPLVMGHPSLDNAKKLARVLFKHFPRGDTLFLASTDMSHFHKYDLARQIDSHTLKLIKAMDTKALAKALGTRKAELCGGGPVLTLMELAHLHGARRVKLKVLQYKNSGDTAGPKSNVVGYCAVAFSFSKPRR